MRQLWALFSPLLFASTIQGIQWLGPSSTDLTTHSTRSETREVIFQSTYAAQITTPPNSALIKNRADLPRQYCGFVDGKKDSSAGCLAPSSCCWNTDLMAVGCCDSVTPHATCFFYTSCIDDNAGSITSFPVGTPYIQTCTGGPKCMRFSYTSGFKQYFCGNLSPSPTSMLPTYFNETPDESNWTAQTLLMGSKELGLNPTATTTAKETITAELITPPPSPSSSKTRPSTSSALSTSSEPTVPPHHHEINTGTIIGASVASAFFGLAAASILAFFYTRKRNERRRLEMANNRRNALAHAGVDDPSAYRSPGSRSPAPIVLVGGPAELVGGPRDAEGPKSVAITEGRSELDGASGIGGIAELDGNYAHHELQGDGHLNIPYIQASSPEHENEDEEELPRPILTGGPMNSHTHAGNTPYPENQQFYGIHSASQVSLTLRALDEPDDEHERSWGTVASGGSRGVERGLEYGRTSTDSRGSCPPRGWI